MEPAPVTVILLVAVTLPGPETTVRVVVRPELAFGGVTVITGAVELQFVEGIVAKFEIVWLA
jgi:hypothetical protein